MRVLAIAISFCTSVVFAASSVRATDSNAPYDTSRILSIGGSVTEVLYALEAADRIVAVDTTSQYPSDALKRNKSVGYMRALSAEGVLSVTPSLILASDSAGPAETVRALKAASVPYVTIPDDPTPAGVEKKVTTIAKAIGAGAKGKALAASIARGFTMLELERARVRQPRKVLFVLNAAGGRMIVGGADTSADAIIRLAGGENAAAKINGFKPIPAESLVAMNPDAILVMKGGRGGGHDSSGLRSLPVVKSTAAGATGRIRDIDGLYLLGFGPRTPDAARDVMAWLYPELELQQ
ncbi:MAG: ABC transporter substrate-binding protein [Pseudomonadota bacterium]